ncbi:MAG: hypothetical protein HONBIEJF_01338 [Fimbriimonadaceae bacterium]|nr:hypothetical protein [Fimbriimonadaceae bacterium]
MMAAAFATLKTDAPELVRSHSPLQPAKMSTVNTQVGEPLENLRALDQAFVSIVDYVSPAVVHIKTMSNSGADEDGRRIGTVSGQGSGVIFRPDGWIITNDHVVNGFDKVTVVLNDGRELQGTVRRANDPTIDIAVVKIDGDQFPTARLADSNKIRSGQYAIAIGSPFGFENSVTIGHISGLGRSNAVTDMVQGTRSYSDLLQTDAPINPGNSGGPLANIDGEVVGINTSIYSGNGGNMGIGFAIPSNQARLIAEMLIEKGKIVRGYLGVLPENLKEFEKKKLKVEKGAILREVPSDGPGATAGLKPSDIVTRVGDVDVVTHVDLRNAMLKYGPGTTVEVNYLRNGLARTAKIKVAEPPSLVARAPESSGSPDDMPKRLREFFGNPDRSMPRLFESEPEGKDVPPLREGKARLGVSVGSISDADRKQFHIPADVTGVVVKAVEPDSVAAKLGMETGDVIQTLGSKPIKTPEDLIKAMADVKWGDTRQLKVSRFSESGRMDQDRPVTFK